MLSLPPAYLGTMWSTWLASTVHLGPRIWHWCPSRWRTLARSLRHSVVLVRLVGSGGATFHPLCFGQWRAGGYTSSRQPPLRPQWRGARGMLCLRSKVGWPGSASARRFTALTRPVCPCPSAGVGAGDADSTAEERPAPQPQLLRCLARGRTSQPSWVARCSSLWTRSRASPRSRSRSMRAPRWRHGRGRQRTPQRCGQELHRCTRR